MPTEAHLDLEETMTTDSSKAIHREGVYTVEFTGQALGKDLDRRINLAIRKAVLSELALHDVEFNSRLIPGYRGIPAIELKNIQIGGGPG